MSANCSDNVKPEEPCVPSLDGSTICTPRCDISSRNLETISLMVSMLSGDRLLDKGLGSDGARIYTDVRLNYGSARNKFNIKYDKNTKHIVVSLHIKVIPLSIYLKNYATRRIATDSNGSPYNIPYYFGRTLNGRRVDDDPIYGLDEDIFSTYNYEYVSRTPSADYLSTIKPKIEGYLNAIPYFLVPDPCCGKITPCEQKISVKFEVDVGTDTVSPHAIINLFSIAERADSANWGETSTYTTGGSEYPYTVAAHEVGHLLGWPDEYFANGGAVHKMYIDNNLHINETMLEPTDDWKRFSGDNLMGGMRLSKIEPYYLCHVKKWFEDKTNKSWRVVT